MRLLDRVLEYLQSHNIFLTGGAGVGKSYLTKEIIYEYQKEFRNVVVLGSTGISAVNIGGQTIHSFFSFGIASNFEELEISDRYNKHRIKELRKVLKSTELLIIDEISMVSGDLLDMILYRLRDANYNGSIMVVGDFFQLPPIQKNRTNSTIFSENLYAFEISSWDSFDFLTLELTEIKRTTNSKFMKILKKLRVGNIDIDSYIYLKELKDREFEIESNSTTLFGRNFEADRLNQKMVASINREEYKLPSIIDIKDKKLNQKRVDSWKKSLPIIENLILKEGIPVIFTTNKWGAYHNGEKGIVEHIDSDSIVVDKDGKLIKVDRFEFELTRSIVDDKGDLDNEVLCSLKQFPLRPAYAITIHKSQGMSLDNLICNVDNIFADSQFYVALSRAVDPSRLKIVYTRGDFQHYLKRVVSVSDSVKNFYKNCKTIKLD